MHITVTGDLHPFMNSPLLLERLSSGPCLLSSSGLRDGGPSLCTPRSSEPAGS